MELEDKEARQLGSLAKEPGIDKEKGKKTQVLSLWKRLLSRVRGRYSYKDDILCNSGKRTAIEKGIQYLKEMKYEREMKYFDLDNVQLPTDPDDLLYQ